jgi:type II secretory ATPase GspE/PulE/Tfp pilus assembly ATPase PilB-like protein
VTGLVELLLAEARGVGASDVHVQPTAEGLEVRWRVDGVLQPVG